MPEEGWIKLYRRLLNSDLWLEEKFTRGQAWIDLVGLANHRDGHIRKRGIKVIVKRGQVGWSEIALAERWGWSRGKVRRFLKELKTVQQIEQQTVQQNKFVTSLINITNYERYQGSDTANGTADRTANGQQTDSKRYRNKNEKKNKNEKNIYTSNFLQFWEAYPKKQGKGDAFKAYQKIKQPKPSVEELIQAVESHKKTKQWQDSQFIPNPATFLNRRQWEDEITANKPKSWSHLAL